MDLTSGAIKREHQFHSSKSRFQVTSSLEASWCFIHQVRGDHLKLLFQIRDVLLQSSVHGQSLGSQRVAVLGLSKQIQKVLKTDNLKCHRSRSVLQPSSHRTPGVEQLELNVMILSPVLQKHQHA